MHAVGAKVQPTLDDSNPSGRPARRSTQHMAQNGRSLQCARDCLNAVDSERDDTQRLPFRGLVVAS